MPIYFFDTSAFAKHYCSEPGSQRIGSLLGTPETTSFISRLSIVELHSAFAKKVRIGELSRTEFELVARRFRGDLRSRVWSILRFKVNQFKAAERLIRSVGLMQNLRTLDALQLAVALNLNTVARRIEFVCADQNLIAIAKAEGLSVINPEVP
jgi:predicted nucleic acid-binding protein